MAHKVDKVIREGRTSIVAGMIGIDTHTHTHTPGTIRIWERPS